MDATLFSIKASKQKKKIHTIRKKGEETGRILLVGPLKRLNFVQDRQRYTSMLELQGLQLHSDSSETGTKPI